MGRNSALLSNFNNILVAMIKLQGVHEERGGVGRNSAILSNFIKTGSRILLITGKF